MRITILTIGSRGDVQPYVALGLGLQATGHKVCFATHAIFEDFVRSRGLDFAPLAGNLKEFFAREEGHAIFAESGYNTIRFVRQFIGNFIRPIMGAPNGWGSTKLVRAIPQRTNYQTFD